MLPGRYRLKNNRSFNYIYRKGKSVGGRYSVLLYTEAKGSLMVGFSVSKKIGCSVTRNLAKRRLRESVRSFLPELKSGYHLIFVARSSITSANFHEIKQNLYKLAQKAGLLAEGKNENALH